MSLQNLKQLEKPNKKNLIEKRLLLSILPKDLRLKISARTKLQTCENMIRKPKTTDENLDPDTFGYN